MNMDSAERAWYIQRLGQQLEKEQKAEKAANERARRKRR